MSENLHERIARLEARVAALDALLLSFIVATRRAQRFVSDTTVELAEAFCDDAVDAGLRPLGDETQRLLDALARLHERGKDPNPL